MAKRKRTLTAARAHELFRYVPSTGKVFRRVRRGHELAGVEVCNVNPTTGYMRVGVDYASYDLHRVIWLMQTGAWPVGEIDHRDRDKLNNRWRNLRDAAKQQNQHNTAARRKNKSGFKWVRSHRPGRFQAFVGHTYLGVFKTALAAHLYAAAYARKQHGKFFNPGRAPGAGKGARL